MVGETRREAWQSVGEAEASSAVLCAEGVLNILSKGEGERKGRAGDGLEGDGQEHEGEEGEHKVAR